ncbi:MAG: methyltransferase domain-containing protein [Alphaproteobacteria bacterium]
MRPDIIDLREFYGGHLGQLARLLVRRRLRAIWPDVRGQSVLGLGYATPYLSMFNEQAERVIALMPAQQGVGRWPRLGRVRVGLADEHALPLPDASIDRVIVAHALENTEQVNHYLREVWRVLTPAGRMLVVVPNRRGLWSRFEHTPFGHGRPYSPDQITRLLRDTLFQPIQREAALYLPPVNSRLLLRGAGAWERIGRRLGAPFAGALIVEAEKQVYAMASPQEAPARRRRLVVVPNRPAVARPKLNRDVPDSDPA